jgi:hypothetical protein
MAALSETALAPSEWFAAGTGTNAAAVATRAAPGAMRRHVVTAVVVTVSGTPTAGGAVTLAGGKVIGGPVSTTLATVGAGALQPIVIPVRFVCEIDAAVTLTLPALGAGVIGSVTLFGYTTSA